MASLRTGKRAALFFALPGTVFLLASIWFFRKPLAEEWYLIRLRSSDTRVRDAAAEELSAMRSERAIPRFIESLEKTPGFLLPLLRIGPSAVAALLDSLAYDEAGQPPREPSSPIAISRPGVTKPRPRTVLGMLTDLGPKEKAEIAPSFAGAVDECREVESKVLALTLLVQMSFDEEAVLPALVKGMRNVASEVRGTAALAAARISAPRAVALVPDLRELLRDPEQSVRSAAVSGLGRLGPAAAPALRALVNTLSDESEYVRSMAALAVARVGTGNPSEVTVPALLAFLRACQGGGEDCLAAAQALGELGLAARAAEPLLEELAQKAEEPLLRQTVETALRRVRGDQRE
jgi:HEAT repeat protein